jgi:hypothetical protein
MQLLHRALEHAAGMLHKALAHTAGMLHRTAVSTNDVSSAALIDGACQPASLPHLPCGWPCWHLRMADSVSRVAHGRRQQVACSASGCSGEAGLCKGS